ncbi:hypothetical protein AMJ39_05605 [candidate division TA06 bacterium DG_24]|nr:MAG: hypothetical protein AMJ39_05605 [candidate division TA06 bacterium DG_24]
MDLLPDRTVRSPWLAAISAGVALLLVLASTPRIASGEAEPAPEEAASSLREQARRMYLMPPDVVRDIEPRTYFGAYLERVEPDSLILPEGVRYETGVGIDRVVPGSPAEEAGFREGDIILSLDQERFGADPDEAVNILSKRLKEKKPGDRIRIEYLRDGRVRRVSAPLGTRPILDMPSKPHPELASIFQGRRDPSMAERAVEQFDLLEEYAEVASQTAAVAAVDYNHRQVLPERPNPFRLQEVTYLLRRPTELALVSDGICRSLEDEFNTEQRNTAELVIQAAGHLDETVPRPPSPPRDLGLDGLIGVMEKSTRMIGEALDELTHEEMELAHRLLPTLLDYEDDWEEALEEIEDEGARKAAIAEKEEELATLFRAALRADLGRLFGAAAYLSQLSDPPAANRIRATLADFPAKPFPQIYEQSFLGDIRLVRETDFGLVVIGGPGTSVYLADAALIVDLGGDDYYANNAGGSRRESPCALVLDFDGDDVYACDSAISQGAGLLGVGILIDYEGNDTYSARNDAQAVGLFGVGMLIDLAGNDSYNGDQFVQGGGVIGLGLLCEGEGTDTYRAHCFSQGFGYVKGLGLVLEVDGEDTYSAGWKYADFRIPDRAFDSMSQGFGFGMRPWVVGTGADGGIGILLDSSGHDVYMGDFFCQGSSYWYALGILLDRSGADRYLSGNYSQGAGIHLSVGALIDEEGDDQYTCYDALCQGAAHDWAAGLLHDVSGNDLYVGHHLVQGGCGTVSMAILADGGGDDTYVAGDVAQSQGAGVWRDIREYGSIGMLIDGGGEDTYSDARISNGATITKETWGIVIDSDTASGDAYAE